MTFTDIIFEEPAEKEGGHLGIIILNRPQVLNAINHAMLNQLSLKLAAWAEIKKIKAVLIRAVPGRAFSAGGDIRFVYEKKIKSNDDCLDFFIDEYQLNKQIAHYSKPYIALLDGITMGGGAGISIHGSHRVGTERLFFAMPETGIGFFPDIGASFFLTRLPYQFGFYLGLTGIKISYEDCYALGIVDQIISHDRQDELVQKLQNTEITDNRSITNIIDSFKIRVPESKLMQHFEEVQQAFSKTSVEDILHTLETSRSDWGKETADLIKTRSPVSLKVTLQLLMKAKTLDFDGCMAMEYHLMRHFLQSHDFYEGIRALLIDKDQKPQWEPGKLSAVTDPMVNRYFEVF